MSHQSQLDFVAKVKELFPQAFQDAKVLEVGSLNINGTVRIFFDNCDYLGIDLGPGKDVDLVTPAHGLESPNNMFDTVISCECFEHDQFWSQSFKRMFDVLKPKGLFVFSCATTGRPEHGTTRTSPADAPFTNDYYHNLTAYDFASEFELKSMFDQHAFSTCDAPADLYFYGIKK